MPYLPVIASILNFRRILAQQPGPRLMLYPITLSDRLYYNAQSDSEFFYFEK